MGIYKRPIVRLVKVPKDEIKEPNLKLIVESNIDKVGKRTAIIGDSQVNYLENTYSNSYHEMEIIFIILSGLRGTCWKNRVNTQGFQKLTHNVIMCGEKGPVIIPERSFWNQNCQVKSQKRSRNWLTEYPIHGFSFYLFYQENHGKQE